MSYTEGEQPCKDYKPTIEYNEYAQWKNAHECPKCGGLRSFCENCHTDHHESGWGTCKVK